MNTRTWSDIGSDVNWIDYGGHWARQITETTYHVIRFDNMLEALGTRDFAESGSGRYHVQLAEVDITSERLADAIRSCDSGDPEANALPLNQVAALANYGAYAPLYSDSGSNAHSLVRAAKSESRRLQRDANAHEQAMSKHVNQIGSTAREYAAGDLSSAILRGLEAGDPKAEILAKMGMLRP